MFDLCAVKTSPPFKFIADTFSTVQLLSRAREVSESKFKHGQVVLPSAARLFLLGQAASLESSGKGTIAENRGKETTKITRTVNCDDAGSGWIYGEPLHWNSNDHGPYLRTVRVRVQAVVHRISSTRRGSAWISAEKRKSIVAVGLWANMLGVSQAYGLSFGLWQILAG